MRLWTALLPLVVLTAPAMADPGLPGEASVRGALDEHPSVIAARARVDAARADARARSKGPHEWILSGIYSRRTIDKEGTFDEFDAQLTKPFRLPGKASLDRRIGAFGVEEAENLAEDAKHQAALLLMEYWIDWLETSAEAAVDAQAVANYETALAAVKRRVELHDAAQLDSDQSEAALGAARTTAEESSGRAKLARARLAAQFPSLPLPAEAPEVPQPEAPEGGLDRLHGLVLSNSHEIAAADAAANRMSSMAQRARKDRLADPSFGVRLFSERGGMERGGGLVLSIPLGGGYRHALADQASADASAARAQAQLARFDIRETADADLASANFRLEAWKRARAGLDSQMAALLKLRRGNELGEIDLADRLLGERMAHDAFRAEAVARAEALRAITKLRIDSHQLWLAD